MTPESVVGWLLEHPEVAAEDSDSLSSVYESDTESISYDNALGAQALTQYVSIVGFKMKSIVRRKVFTGRRE